MSTPNHLTFDNGPALTAKRGEQWTKISNVKSQMSNVKGFTLIELMVVITIIAILSAISFVVYSEVQQGARDSKRKSDLRSISQALLLYHQKNGRFPCTEDSIWQKSSDAAPWVRDPTSCVTSSVPLGENYIDLLPKDPKQNDADTCAGPWVEDCFKYSYWAGDGSTVGLPNCPAKGQVFALVARLEKSDSDSNIATANLCGGLLIESDLIPGGEEFGTFYPYILTSQSIE